MKKLVIFIAFFMFGIIFVGTNVNATDKNFGNCGEDLNWTLDDEGTLTIFGSGEMKNYSSSSSPFYDNNSIKHLIVKDGVTSIGEYAFYKCSGLTSVSLSNDLTSIGWGAFRECTDIKSVNIPDGVTEIAGYTFEGCNRLTSVSISGVATSIGLYAFQGCSGLTSVSLSNNLTSIGLYAFQGCSSLTSVSIPEGVTSIGWHAFQGCSSLKSINIPKGVTSIEDYTFEGCSKLVSVSIPQGVTSIGEWAFRGNRSLKNVVIPESVVSIKDKAFFECYSLTSIVIPSSISSIGSSAFSDTFLICDEDSWLFKSDYKDNCFKADDYVDIKAGAELNYRFEPSSGILTVSGYGETYSDFDYKYKKNVNKILFEDYTGNILPSFSGFNNLNEILIPEGIASIGNKAFYGCSSLTHVDIPEKVTRIGDWAFWGSSLNSILIPEGISEIGVYAFRGCNLTKIEIPSGVKSIGSRAFYNCSELKQATILSETTNIGSEVFCRCSSLEKCFIYSSYGIKINADAFKGDNTIIYGHTNIKEMVDGWNYANVTYSDLCCIEVHDEVVEVEKKPSCIDKGKTEGIYCACCGEILNKQEDILPKGHNYGDYISNKDATCTKNGTKTRECKNMGCSENTKGHFETVVDDGSMLDHRWNKYYTVDINSTTTVEGSKSIHCSVCNEKKEGSELSIPKLESATPAPTATLSPSEVPTATPASGTNPTATPAPGTNPTATLAPGTNPTATPAPGTDPTATPAPGTNPTATPAPGTNPTATPVSGTNNTTANKTTTTTKASQSNNTKPAAVSSFKAKAAKGKLTLSWNKSSGASGYEIQYSLKSNFKNSKKVTISKASTKTKTIKGLKKKKEYYVRIRAYKKSGSKKIYSAWKKISKKTK